MKVIVSEAKYKQVFASCHKKAFFDFTSDNFNSQNDHEEEVFLPGKYISCRLKMFTECHVKQFSLAVCSKGGGGGIYKPYKLTDVLNQAINRVYLAILLSESYITNISI